MLRCAGQVPAVVEWNGLQCSSADPTMIDSDANRRPEPCPMDNETGVTCNENVVVTNTIENMTQAEIEERA